MTLQEIVMQAFNEGKEVYPQSLIAVEHDNALYFLYGDAELIANLYGSSLEQGADRLPLVIVPKDEHNDLATVLYANKVLMCVIKTQPQEDEILAAEDLRKAQSYYDMLLKQEREEAQWNEVYRELRAERNKEYYQTINNDDNE